MSPRKIIAIAASVVSLGGAAFGLLPASATEAGTFACEFTGTTGANGLTPAIQNGVVYSITGENPTAPPGQAPYTTSDQGTFTFSGGPTGPDSCSAVEGSNQSVHQITSITASGSYDNIVCGTGEAHGVADAYDANGTLIAVINFTINFANGAGTMTSAGTAYYPNGSPAFTFNDAGSVVITPIPNNPPAQVGCVNTAATGFNVQGTETGAGAAA